MKILKKVPGDKGHFLAKFTQEGTSAAKPNNTQSGYSGGVLHVPERWQQNLLYSLPSACNLHNTTWGRRGDTDTCFREVWTAWTVFIE